MTELTDRQKHLAWCKERALEYVNAGDLPNAVASMSSDMNKHPETKFDNGVGAILMQLGMMEVINGNVDGVRRWIEGFN